ncbi:MAG: hypothetical protein A07HB70_00171, partial [uncultured archaeon A07HB70]
MRTGATGRGSCRASRPVRCSSARGTSPTRSRRPAGRRRRRRDSSAGGRVKALVEILLGPDGAVPRGGEARTVEGDEAARQHRSRLGVARAAEHRGPEDGVVLDDVPADDVDDLAAGDPLVGRVRHRAAGRPDLAPVVLVGADPAAVLFRRGDVLDRGVDPDVQHEVVALVAGVVDTPVHVPGDTPVTELALDPLPGLVLRVLGAIEP